MSLQSPAYFLFLPLVALLCRLCLLLPGKGLPCRLRNLLLWAASLYFYLLAAPKLLVVTLASTLFTYACGRGLATRHKTAFLRLGVVGSLVLLAVFKYANFFAPQLTALFAQLGLGYDLTAHPLIMPLGLSFYSFAAIGYLVDAARGDTPIERDFVAYALFVGFFGTITSGPICRAGTMLPQYHTVRPLDAADLTNALRLYALGLFKKVAVADVLALVVNRIFAAPGQMGAPMLLLGAVGYTLFLYFDFCGYSEMARATGLALGLELPENFKTPFFATNFSGFWNRWHISLSAWLQDYVFTSLIWAQWPARLPVLGKKWQRLPPLFCVFTVFFLSGFWHGNTLPFVVWGLLQALYRVGEELLHRHLGKPKKRAPARVLWAKRAGVFVLWTFSMVFFRVGSGPDTRRLGEAFAYLGGLAHGWQPGRFWAELTGAVSAGFYADSRMVAAYLVFVPLVLALAFWLDGQRFFHHKDAPAEQVLAAQPTARRWALYYALVLCILAGLIIQSGGFGGSVSFAYAQY